MTPTPVVLSFTFSDYVIIEEGTAKTSLIGCFDQLAVSSFPSPPRAVFLAAELTGGHGPGRVGIRIARPDTDETVKQTHGDVYFRGRLFVVRYRMRVMDCSFPVPGRYAVQLLVDGELAAQRILEVTPGGSS